MLDKNVYWARNTLALKMTKYKKVKCILYTEQKNSAIKIHSRICWT